MSNPFDPNAPGPTSPQPWGTQPSQQPQQQWASGPTQQGAWNGPQGPYAPPPNASGGGSKWVIGCLVVLGIAVACCGGSIFFGFRYSKKLASRVVQEQATAMGNGNYAEVCRHNTPMLQANTPCGQYVAWLATYAPWFSGATINADDVNIESDPTRGARFTVRVSGSGPHGSGHLTFRTVPLGNQFLVDAIVPQQ